MDFVFSPFGLVILGAVYYYCRRNGELKFRMPGHTEFAEELNQECLDKWHLMPHHDGTLKYDLEKSIKEKIQNYLTQIRISRMKVHDLKYTVRTYIENQGIGHGEGAEFRATRSEIAYTISKLFDEVITHYDSRTDWKG